MVAVLTVEALAAVTEVCNSDGSSGKAVASAAGVTVTVVHGNEGRGAGYRHGYSDQLAGNYARGCGEIF